MLIYHSSSWGILFSCFYPLLVACFSLLSFCFSLSLLRFFSSLSFRFLFGFISRFLAFSFVFAFFSFSLFLFHPLFVLSLLNLYACFWNLSVPFSPFLFHHPALSMSYFSSLSRYSVFISNGSEQMVGRFGRRNPTSSTFQWKDWTFDDSANRTSPMHRRSPTPPITSQDSYNTAAQWAVLYSDLILLIFKWSDLLFLLY